MGSFCLGKILEGMRRVQKSSHQPTSYIEKDSPVKRSITLGRPSEARGVGL